MGDVAGLYQTFTGHQLSTPAQVNIGGEIYIFECVSAGFIRLEPSTDPEGDFPMLPHTSHHPTQRRRAGSIVHHICDPVTPCEREALDELSEGLICT